MNRRETVNKTEILEVLNLVYDPDYVERSILDMGLVTEDDITIKDNEIEVAYDLTAPLCPFSAAIGLMIKHALEKKLGVPITVRLKAGHHRKGVVNELLQAPDKSQQLMRQLQEFGIMERCVRF